MRSSPTGVMMRSLLPAVQEVTLNDRLKDNSRSRVLSNDPEGRLRNAQTAPRRHDAYSRVSILRGDAFRVCIWLVSLPPDRFQPNRGRGSDIIWTYPARTLVSAKDRAVSGFAAHFDNIARRRSAASPLPFSPPSRNPESCRFGQASSRAPRPAGACLYGHQRISFAAKAMIFSRESSKPIAGLDRCSPTSA